MPLKHRQPSVLDYLCSVSFIQYRQVQTKRAKFKMKYFIVFSLFLVAVAYADMESYATEIRDKTKECAEEQDVTLDTIDEWMRNRDSLNDEDKKKSSCITACVMKKLDMMENNVIKIDDMIARTDELYGDNTEKKNQMVEAINTCSEEVKDKTDECDKAGEFENCIRKKRIEKEAHNSNESKSAEA